jgi:RNA polymerase sigma factor (sigma-70 family)
MVQVTTASIVRQIGSLFEGGSVTGLSDRQLIERFIGRRDPAGEGEAAFAALVARHGPTVLGVCRQLLGDRHHAEDAFQATFFVLARKARSIHDPDLLANWLYGVALRTARKARCRLARRRQCEESGSLGRPEVSADAPADEPVVAREQAEALHDEIGRLPVAFRLPVVLCYFEGLTVEEAARQLRWPHGTVRSRLARARDKLRHGLTRRGVVLPAAVLAAALDFKTASASISSPLCHVTTQAAIQFAAGQTVGEVVSTSAAALAQEVIRSMFFTKLKLTVLTLIVLGSVATGMGYLTHSSAMKDEPKPVLAGQRQQPAAKVDEPNRAAPGRMIVAGRVLDPVGKPMAAVPVDILGRPRWLFVTAARNDRLVLLGQGVTDADGRFRLDAARTSSAGFFEVYAVVSAPGHGCGWVVLNPDAAEPAAELRLKPEQVIRGRLVDLNGQPAAGVELRVASFGQAANVERYVGREHDIRMGSSPPKGVRSWPHPLKTDDHGRFASGSVARGLYVTFSIQDQRFAPQSFDIATDDRDGPKEVNLALQPATVIEGRVLAADTGQPIPNALLEVGSSHRFMATGMTTVRADAQGRFQANPYPGDRFDVDVYPPEGQPYLASDVEFAWAKGAVKKEIDVKLPRGVVIRGKVTEQGTGRSLSGASIQYLAINGPPNVKACWEVMVASKDDGSFQIVVPPGKGHLLVFGPTSDYILEVIGGNVLSRGEPGGQRNYAHKIIVYEVKAGDQSHAINAVLRPGKTIKGRVVGPQGETVEHAAIITQLHIESFNTFWRGDSGFQLHARDGFFELHGLDPEKSVPVYFLDDDHQWGATVEFSGKQANDEVTVRLQPNGQAKARFVGPDGKPVAKLVSFLYFEFLPAPGPHQLARDKAKRGQFEEDIALMSNVDPKHYRRKSRAPLSDADGRITLPDLIPGARYRFSDRSNRDKPAQIRKEFTVKPGETLDLGDILIEKPQT